MLTIALACTALCYIAIPIVGAIITHRRWLWFRRVVSDAALWPRIDTNNPVPMGTTGTEVLGNYCFFGALEALQGKDVVWISDGTRTIVAYLRNQPLFLFGHDTSAYSNRPVQTPQLANWRQVTSLPEGAKIFIAGSLVFVRGQLQFRTINRRGHLLVVLYDDTQTELTKRLIWHGRQRNEFWNVLTLPALCAGMFMLSILSFISVRLYGSLQLVTLVIIVMALMPILVLMPPGVFGFFLYRRLWGASWLIHAKCDMHQLLEHVECRRWRARLIEIGAGLLLLTSLFINGYLALLLMSRIIL